MHPAFPLVGSKIKTAQVILSALGKVNNYVEPFAGTLSVLLANNNPPRHETVNDADGLVTNFYRSVQDAPEVVARHADRPVNALDLASLRSRIKGLAESLVHDPAWCNPRLAGEWVYVQCASIKGVLDGNSRPSLERRGLFQAADKLAYLKQLSARLRNVVVLHGDWSKAVTPCVTTRLGLTGVLLDPPYGPGRSEGLYRVDSVEVAAEVRKWAVQMGANEKLRIVLCGSPQEHDMPKGWTTYRCDKTWLWFSPHCQPPAAEVAA